VAQTLAKRAAELRATIDEHNRKYYVEAKPSISDREFDKLLQELIDLEKKHPELVTPDSPTQRVGGAPIDGFAKVKHLAPMMSIDNSYDAADLRKFDADVRKGAGPGEIAYSVELKIDGVSISIVYEDGLLKTGATRGSGEIGDDVTHNLRTIPGIPLRLNSKKPPKLFEVRGEIYMTRAELVRINAQKVAAGEDPYANTRNLTAGTLKQLDPKESAKRKLRLFAYGTGVMDGVEIATQRELFDKLREFGFPVNDSTVFCATVDEVLAQVDIWNTKRHDLPYDTDGLVVKLDRFDQRKRLGATSKVPKWAKAYKFEAEQGITKLHNVAFEIGKYGELTPVAEFDPPVQLAGTQVRRASMHNASWVEKRDVRLGDTVVVEKAGEIIPQVVSVVLEARPANAKPLVWPTTCPVCGAPVEKDETAISYGFYCSDVGRCPAQVTKRIVGFARRERMDVDGLGDEVAKQLVDSGLVKSVTDLYGLTEKQLLTLEKFGKTKAKNLLAGIENSKQRGLARLLPSLSIYGVGGSMSDLVVEEFSSLDAVVAASKDDLAKVKGVGPKRAENIYDFFHCDTGETLVIELKKLGLKLTHDKKVVALGTQPLLGKTVVVTGSLVNYDRITIEARIKDLGGKSSGSVSKKTDYVLAGAEAGSKLTKAKELGVRVLTEDEFEKLALGKLEESK